MFTLNDFRKSRKRYGHVYLSSRILVNISGPIKWHDKAKFVTL